MKLTEKLKSYKFWVALTSAVIIFLQTIGKELGFSISEEVITNIVMTLCGILVLLGFIDDDRNTPTTLSLEDKNEPNENALNASQTNSQQTQITSKTQNKKDLT